LDSGDGAKLERYGTYTLVRPEHQAVWKRMLPQSKWEAVHGVFQPSGEESGGHWNFSKPVPPSWRMNYMDLRFNAYVGNSRHMGFFPEQAVQWDWARKIIKDSNQKVQVLNLFGYSGLASLACLKAGAQVTHVDASKKAIVMAKGNLALSGLENRPVRWLVDDVYKFVRRETRRGANYDAILLDPPKFGRGPQGQVWEFFEFLPALLAECRRILTPQPLFIILTAYAIRASALSCYYALQESVTDLGGKIETGELALTEKSAGRLLSTAIFARWSWRGNQKN